MKKSPILWAVLALVLFVPLSSRAGAGERKFVCRVDTLAVAPQMQEDARVVAMARARREVLAQVAGELAGLPAVRKAELSGDALLPLAAALVSPHAVSLDGDKGERPLASPLAFEAELNATAIHSQVKALLAEEDRLARYGLALDFEKKLLDQAREILARPAASDLPGEDETVRDLHAVAVKLAALTLTQMANDAFLKSPRDMGKAWEYYTGAVRLDPECVPAYSNRAVLYLTKDQFQKAVEDLTRVVRLMPENAAAWQDRGVAFGELGRPDLAVADFTRAIALSPERAGAYAARGFARIMTGDKPGGCEDLSEACAKGQCSYLKDARKKGACP